MTTSRPLNNSSLSRQQPNEEAVAEVVLDHFIVKKSWLQGQDWKECLVPQNYYRVSNTKYPMQVILCRLVIFFLYFFSNNTGIGAPTITIILLMQYICQTTKYVYAIFSVLSSIFAQMYFFKILDIFLQRRYVLKLVFFAIWNSFFLNLSYYILHFLAQYWSKSVAVDSFAQ